MTLPSPDLIGHNHEEIPEDIEELVAAVSEMMAAAVEELNCITIPNKGQVYSKQKCIYIIGRKMSKFKDLQPEVCETIESRSTKKSLPNL